MCDRPATSREHVPPLCLFPEAKDTGGRNFRKDLITVPSCDEHNSKKSTDDEFLMVAISGIVGNNALAYRHTLTKVDRALRRKSSQFLAKAVLRNARSVFISGPGGRKMPVLYGNPDANRLNKCFEQIARALYYHKFSTRFIGECQPFMGFLTYANQDHNTLKEFIKKRFELEKLREEVEGSNTEVFHYQFCRPDAHGLIALKMTLYQGAEVYIGFVPYDKEVPFHLGFYLKGKGIQTVFTLGDEEFRFNERSSDTG